MRSFTLRNPMAVEGTPSERRFGVFCKWITTVAHMAEEVVIKKKKFDANKWLTCRPWLSYSELHSCYLQFLKISVGYMQCGKILLTNKQVSALVYYERFLTSGKHMSDDITSIILSLYKQVSTRRTARTVVFKDVNAELVRRGLRPLIEKSVEWLCALQGLGDASRENNYHLLYLERILPSAKQIEEVLLMYYYSTDTPITDTEDTDPFQEISEYFRMRKLIFTRNSLAWGSVREKYPHVKRIPFDLQKHIDKWFVPAIPGQTWCRRSEVIDVVNFSLMTPIPTDSLMWTHCIGPNDRVKLNRKTHIDYRSILDEHFELSETPRNIRKVISKVRSFCRVQMPFLLRAMKCKAGFRPGDGEVYLRLKQRINWKWIIRTYLAPGEGPGVVSFCNFWLKHHGYETYPKQHSIWKFANKFHMKKDIVLALKILREKSPKEFLDPPRQLQMVVGSRKSTRIYDPKIIEDSPTPKHPKRIRLIINRKYKWGLHSKSIEWKWAMNIRAESEAQKVVRGATVIRDADQYDSKEFMLN